MGVILQSEQDVEEVFLNLFVCLANDVEYLKHILKLPEQTKVQLRSIWRDLTKRSS